MMFSRVNESWRGKILLLFIHWAYVLDALTFTLTLGFYKSEFGYRVLFSEWASDHVKGPL